MIKIYDTIEFLFMFDEKTVGNHFIHYHYLLINKIIII